MRRKADIWPPAGRRVTRKEVLSCPIAFRLKKKPSRCCRGARVNPYLVSLIVVGVLGLLGGLDSYVGASQTVDQMAGYDPDLAAMLPSFPEFPVLLVAFVAAVNWLAQAILSAGWSIYHLGVRRGKEMPFSCLLDGFGFLGKLILLNIVMSIYRVPVVPAVLYPRPHRPVPVPLRGV